MYTTDGFKAAWQKRHYPATGLSSDMLFYYDVYRHLHDIARHSAKRLDDAHLLTLAMYIENNATIGIDPLYESMYSGIGDVVGHWCGRLGVFAKDCARMYSYATDAVASAPADGSLRRWVSAGVLSGEFSRLEDVALFFARQDRTLRLFYSGLNRREEACMRLARNDTKVARRMLWTDMAFNWCDKEGVSLPHRLAGRFRTQEDGEGVASNLLSVSSGRPDAYQPLECKDSRTMALANQEGRVFGEVVFPAPLPGNWQNRRFAGQLVSYLGTTYACGGGVWQGAERNRRNITNQQLWTRI